MTTDIARPRLHRLPPSPVKVTGKLKRGRKYTELGLSLRLPRLTHFNPKKPLHWAAVALVLVAIIAPIWNAAVTEARYRLTPDAMKLLPEASDKYRAEYDKSQQAYVYTSSSNNVAGQSKQVGGSGYEAVFPADPTKGITIRDKSNDLNLSFTPSGSTMDAKSESGHIVYPHDTADSQLVYTIKANGVKEDILLPSEQGDTETFQYTLDLPDTLDARLLPNGDLGFYSVDPALTSSNISFGSDADRQALEKARANGKKDHLAFIMPAPIINQAHHSNAAPSAKFVLNGDILTVTAAGLKGAAYPLSIDPTLIVTSVNDFQNGNLESNIDLDSTNNQISRGGLSGGTVGSWGDGTDSLSYGVQVIYNGYAYNLGLNRSWYVKVGSDGSGFLSGTLKTSNGPTYMSGSPDQIFTFLAYNGYMYAFGGDVGTINNSPCGGLAQPSCTYTFNSVTNVQYAKINSDGSLGVWQNTSYLATYHQEGSAFAYNGYIYLVNDWTAPNDAQLGYTQFVKVNPDGSLGTWQTSSTLTFTDTVYSGTSMSMYNGYVYVMGGQESGSNNNITSAKVYYSKITSSGFNAWNTTASLSLAVMNASGVAYKGYVYVFGGCNQGGGADCKNNSNIINTVQFASINADGTLGSWNRTNGMSTSNGRENSNAVSYGSYLYVSGGKYCSGTGGACSSGTDYTDVQYAKLDSPGTLSAVTTSPTNTITARTNAAEVAFDSYLYVIGGCTANCSSSSGTFLTDTAYLKLNPDGSIGDAGCGVASWCDDTSNQLPGPSSGGVASSCKGREAMSAVAYNHNIYIVGGDGLTGALCNTYSQANDVYYAYIGFKGGDISGWNLASDTFANAVDYPGVAIFNSNLYVMGGRSGNTVYNTVQYAPFNMKTGNLGGAFTTTTGMPSNLFGQVAFTAKGYLYALGGSTANNASIQTGGYYTKIDTSGALDINGPCGQPWCATGTMNSARQFAFGQVVNGNIYVAGGTGDLSSWLSSIEYAPINDNGTLGTFTVSPAALSQGRGAGGSGALIDGRLYIIGGCTSGSCTAYSNAVDVFQVNNGGQGVNNTFTSDASTIPTSTNQIGGQGFIAYNGYLYSVGGCTAWNGTTNNTCTTTTSVVSYAPINSDGSLGAWVSSSSSPGSVTALPIAKTLPGAFAYNGFIYFYGGCSSFNTTSGACNDTTDEQKKVYYAKPNSDGSLTSTNTPCGGVWCVATSRVAYGGSPITESGGYLYSVAGGESLVYHVPIASNGDITASWISDSNVPVHTVIYGNTLLAYDNYLYVMGGYISGNSYAVSTVQYAPIDRSTGAVGQWKSTSDLMHGSSQPAVVAADGYVYVYGGWNMGQTGGTPSNCYDDVQVAPVLSDGSLGQFVGSGLGSGKVSSAPVLALNGSELFAANGNCGTFSSSEDNIVRRASYLAQPRTAHYSYLSDLATDVTPTKMVLDGTAASGTTNVSVTWASAPSVSPVFGQATTSSWYPLGSLLSAVTLDGSGNQLAQGRYLWISLTIDDSGSATFPDTASSQSSITDFLLYFHPATSTRLRGGKAFVNSNCRVSTDSTDSNGNCSLDASP